jgi:hypothetical protein
MLDEQMVVSDVPAGEHESTFLTEVLPFAAVLAAMIIATIAIDVALHEVNQDWLGRYLGIPGTVLIILSFLYSLRKRNIIRRGSIKHFLTLHEVCSWLGSLLILVHSGIHFHGLVAWLATLAIIVAVVSGLTGRCLLQRSQRKLYLRREFFLRQGKTEDETEKEILWEALAVDTMAKWRVAHLPVTWAVCALAGIHVVVVLMFWAWA